MSLTRTKSKQKVKQTRTPITWKEIKRQKVLLFWAGVMMIYGVIFYYLPLAGWAMAFQNYKPQLGILHSEFVGLQKFRMLFSDVTFLRVIRNTLAMGVINLVATFVTAIVFAILLNEIKSRGGKKSNMSAPFCSFTKGREKEYNLNISINIHYYSIYLLNVFRFDSLD